MRHLTPPHLFPFFLILFSAATIRPVIGNDLQTDLAQRREAVMDHMGQQGMLILFSADQRRYSGDVDYEYRQENNLYYLTGIRQAGVTLVLMPQNQTRQEILFLPEPDPEKELWTGKTLDSEGATTISGIPTVWEASEFNAFLDSVLYGKPYRVRSTNIFEEYEKFFEDLRQDRSYIYLLLDRKPGFEGELTKEFEFAARLRERFTGVRIKDSSKIFQELRAIKTPLEIEQLRRAISITIEAHREVMRMLRPELWEYEVEAVIEYIFKKRNSFDWAFPSIVASGPNSTILHYHTSQRRMHGGDLLLVDIGAEYNYYAADITRTIPVNGRFSGPQKEIYQLVLNAQEATLEMVAPGVSFSALNEKATTVLREGLLELGLITDISSRQYRAFFPHGVGHFLGLDVHDVSGGDTLKPNMVITVEPGLYIREDALERLTRYGVPDSDLAKLTLTVERYKNIGIRIEDDVLVIKGGYELLSGQLPREISEIERITGTLHLDH